MTRRSDLVLLIRRTSIHFRFLIVVFLVQSEVLYLFYVKFKDVF